MGDGYSVVKLLEGWLASRLPRVKERFAVERVNDWGTGDEHGVAVDFVGERVIGRVTAWPGHLSSAGWPFADVEALDVQTGKSLLYWAYQPLSAELLDRWLAELEAHERSQ
jgi:hypothetical protein